MTPADPVSRPESEVAGANFSARDALLAWMQEIAPYGIFTTDCELRIRSWNRWLVSHSGLTAEHVIGRLLTDLFPEVHSRRLDEHFRRALRGEVSMLSTALHKHLLPFEPPATDVEVPHMLQTVRVAPLPAGDQIVGTITIIEDVTQRECQALLLQRQQEHDRLLSSALGMLLQSRDPLRDIAALFPRITLPLGLEAYFNHLYDPDAGLLRLNTASGIPPKQRETFAQFRLGEGYCGACAASRQTLIIDHLQGRSDGAAQALRNLGMRVFCAFPLLIEDRLLGTLSFASYTRDSIAPDEVECLSIVAQYVAIAIDRAVREQELRQAQQTLSNHAELLETKVNERTARLHDTIAQLESFSYTVAHDLRAPIRSLKGYCDILLSDYSLPDSGQHILQRLRRASHRLDALTRDLLKFSKISRQEIELEPVDIAELVDDIVLLTPALQDDVVVLHPPLEKVLAQRTLLQQCLSNLFDNAVKFVAAGRQPRIVVRTERTQIIPAAGAVPPAIAFNPAIQRTGTNGVGPGGAEPAEAVPAEPVPATVPRVRIWVEDNGIGIAPEAHDKIFGIFERVSGLDHIEGTGIGLAIVARAVQRMNGTCGVESNPGNGSRFWLELAPVGGGRPAA
jgi:signal transduction histidine kinase